MGNYFLPDTLKGGHASFAAQKYLEELKDPRFIVTASSPMSGAYDMTGEQENICSKCIHAPVLFAIFISVLPRGIPCFEYR